MKKMFHGQAPVFYVSDLMQSLDYYCEVLGFDRPHLWGDPPAFAMPKREDMIVMLSLQQDRDQICPKAHIWDVYYWVRDARALFEEYRDRGAEITQDLMVKEQYGNLEFIIRVPDGYTLAFGQETKEDALYDFEPTGDFGDTKLLYLSPVLATSDLQRDLDWYATIGFKTIFLDRSSDPLGYAVVGRQDLYLHLQFQYPEDMTSTDVRIQVREIDFLFDQLVEQGLVAKTAMRRSTPWRTNEFGLFDPSGNRIFFFEDL